MKISAQNLTDAVTRIFVAGGCDPETASCIAENLVDSNLCGHDSHGVIRVVQYMSYLRNNTVNPRGRMQVAYETPSVAVVDGQIGFGQVIGRQAMNLLADKAEQTGLAMVSIRNSSHIGRIGAWVEQLASRDLISLHFMNTTGLGMLAMPFGGTDRRLSLCVVAAGVPLPDRDPVLLDFATTMTAEGKLRVARNKGVPVPDGQIVDSTGNPSTDANDFYNGGAILPMAGHKGHGLTMIADLLAGALSGGGCTHPDETLMVNTMTSIAINPGPMTDRDQYANELIRYCDWVTGSPPRNPDQPVQLPGQMEFNNRRRRTAAGIEVDDLTWQQISETAGSVGISADELGALVVDD